MTIHYDDERGWVARSRKSEVLLRDLLKAEREKRGMSIGQLQTWMGVTHPMYYNWETGKTINTTVPFRALEALDISLCIFGGCS